MKRLLIIALILTAACQDRIPTDVDAEILIVDRDGFRATPEDLRRFVVVLAPTARPDEVVRDHGLRPDFLYGHALNGFAGTMAQAARAGLLRDSRVLRIEPDLPLTTQGGTQENATWGLDRIDQRALPRDNRYTYTSSGAGVTAYILDTGIRYTHTEFRGRAAAGFDAFGGDGSDCHGHGTHVAGTVGGTVYGVAKEVQLRSVRVLNCNGTGTSSTLIAGLDWIVAHGVRPAVANMSLGGGASTVIDDAVRRVIAAGVPVAVAAGNNATDACNISPARTPEALTTGASDENDVRASFSNFGDCVDLFAPGRTIYSSGYGSDDMILAMSGTSMASPHVAGTAALVLSARPDASPHDVRAAVLDATTKGIVTSAQSSSNHLLYSLTGDVAPPPPPAPNAAPVAAFEAWCSGLTCEFADRSTDPDGYLAAWSWSLGDGTGSTARSLTHTYAAGGTYTVTLTVTDNAGASASSTGTSTVAPNAAPEPAFDVVCDDLACTFVDASSDPDGTIVRRIWSFGDGSPAAADAATGEMKYAYAMPGSYEVRLTVVDDANASATAAQQITVSGVGLAATAFKYRGRHNVTLEWAGAAGSSVAISMNGSPFATVPNNGSWTHDIGKRGQGTYQYRVCETGGSRCSVERTVRF